MSSNPTDNPLERINSRIRDTLGEHILFYIGIINTFVLIAIGSIITYTLSIGGTKGDLSTISAGIFGVAAITVFYHSQKQFGPNYDSGREDILVFVLLGSLSIAVLPVVSTSILGLMGIQSFLFYILGVFIATLSVILLVHLTVFKPMEPEISEDNSQ